MSRALGLLVAAVVTVTTAGITSATASAEACQPPQGATLFGVPWAQKRLDPSRVWDLTRGRGIEVAVVDSGVAAAHPQLRGAVQRGVSVAGDGSSATEDCAGHGTLVAGIIAGRGSPDSTFSGIAPDAIIVPIKIISSLGDVADADQRIAKGIDTAVSQGVDVINVSATTTNNTPDLRAAVRRALDHDIVVVAAGGNDEDQSQVWRYPAAYPGVIAVAATTESESRAEFSETAPYIAVAAPGKDVTGPAPSGSGYLNRSGTSFAAPFVAGVAALLRAYYPDLTAPEIIWRIEETADRMPDGPDAQFGAGVVNPYRAVTALLDKSMNQTNQGLGGIPPAPDPADPLATTKVAALIVSCVAVIAAVAVILAVLAARRGRYRR